MSFKSLLTFVTDAELSAAPLDYAQTIAAKLGAHLDVDCLGIDATQAGYYYGGANAVIQQDSIHHAQETAEGLEVKFRELLGRQDISWGCQSGVAQLAGLTRMVAHHARFTDLVILPKPYGEGVGPEQETILEAALFDGHAPVVVVPQQVKIKYPPKRIVVAWNQSPEALAAIRAALPLLIEADIVNIAIIDPSEHGPDRSDPGGALSQMLARHGVRAEISVLAKTLPRVADVITRHIRDLDADMLVMGAYGHSRFREAILGGATRDMLELAEVPVLMAR